MPEGRRETPEERHKRKMAEVQKNIDNAKRQHEAWVASGRQYMAFDAYAEYRQPLRQFEQDDITSAVEEEKEKQEKDPIPEEMRWSDGHVEGFIDGDYRLALYAEMAVRMNIATDRTAAQLDKDKGDHPYPIYPEEPGLMEKYPGIDPLGHYTEAEMSLTYRLEQVKAAAAVRPPEVRAYVSGVLEDMAYRDDNNTPIRKVVNEMKNKCTVIRYYNRAAKVAPDRITSEHLEEEAFIREMNCASLKWMDGTVKALEYLTGLSDEPITDKQREELAKHDRAIPPGLEALRDTPNIQPASLKVEFSDFEHERQYRFFSSPQNWGKPVREMMRRDFAPGHEEAVAGIIGRYASATASRTLDGCFRQIEGLVRNTNNPNEEPAMNRGDLVTVDGMTIREHMERQYLNEHKSLDGFGRFYRENFRQQSGAIVSAALMAGKRVEAFIPDKQGRIPDEPVQITKTGFEPSPLKKVTLNAWERHFAKHGFYKEKLARAEEYRRVMESRERVKAINVKQRGDLQATSGDFLKNQIFGGREASDKAMAGHATQYSWTRGFPTTLAVSVMMAQGHSFEDIMNPDMLREEKLAAGREVIKRTLADDHAWIGEKLHDGYAALIEETDRLMSSFNVADPRQIQEHYAEVAGRNGLLFDLYQEATRPGTLEGFLARAEEVAPGTSAQREFEMEERTRALGTLQLGMSNIVDGKIFYSNPNRIQQAELSGEGLEGSEIGNYFTGVAVTQRFAQAMQAGAPASRAMGGMEAAGLNSSAGMAEHITDLLTPVHELKDNKLRGQIYRAVQHLATHDRLHQALPTALSRQQMLIPLDSFALGADGKRVTTPQMTDVGQYTLRVNRKQFIQTLHDGAKKLESARRLEERHQENTVEAAAKREQEAAKPSKTAQKVKPAEMKK